MIDVIFADKARAAVLRQYAEAFDRFAEAEQVLTDRGCVRIAEQCHQLGLAILRAYRNEQDDPQPPGLEP